MIRQAGSDFINFYVLEDRGALTIIDAGMPTYWPYAESALRAMGCTAAEVKAVVLTHVDPDHVGFAAELQQRHGTPVLVHRLDAGRARTGAGKQTEARPPVTRILSHSYGRRVALHMARNGGVRMRPIVDVTEFEDGDVLDVPGGLRVVHTPGHSDGHCSLVAAADDAIFIGDAMSNRDVLTGTAGPRVPNPAGNTSTATAFESLARIEDLTEGTLFFGHGDPYDGGAAAAVAQARSKR